MGLAMDGWMGEKRSSMAALPPAQFLPRAEYSTALPCGGAAAPGSTTGSTRQKLPAEASYTSGSSDSDHWLCSSTSLFMF
jgi:hypothetical protein